MIKKITRILLAMFIFLIASCSQHDANPNVIVVGTIAGPETELMEVAKQVAMHRYGLEVKIVAFKNYGQLNPALINGQIEANAFQDEPYLNLQMQKYGYHSLVSVGKTFLYPMGLYSHTLLRVSDLKLGSTVAIPDSDVARGLLLLQSAGLIKLSSNNPESTTTKEIISNPKNLHIVEMDAADLTQELHHIPLAAINTNYAMLDNLSPSKNALFVESSNTPYVNHIIVRAENEYDPKVKKLVAAYQSQPVREKAEALFGNNAIPGF